VLSEQGVRTALALARRPEAWVTAFLSKPFYEIWQELNGKSVLPLETEEQSTYQSIQKVKTFTPPSCDGVFVFAQLSKNIENACIKARKYRLAAREVFI
jgi:DNA polymerase-4/DNA polymerase V